MEDLEMKEQVETIQITALGQNTDKSPGDSMRLAVTRTEKPLLTLVRKTLKGVSATTIIIIIIIIIRTKVDDMQPISKCELCGNRDETVNHIVIKYSNQEQREYKTRQAWVGLGNPFVSQNHREF